MHKKKNSPKILTVFRKTVDDGLNPPVQILSDDKCDSKVLRMLSWYIANNRHHIVPCRELNKR